MTNTPLCPLDNIILDIEGATGHTLPYDGYIEAKLQIPGLNNMDQDTLLLVVPDTNFNSNVPVIIGTNIIQPLQTLVGNAQRRRLDNAWTSAFHCLSLQETQIRRHDGRLALLKSANKIRIVIPPNKTISVACLVDRKFSLQNCCAIIQASTESTLPDYIKIAPVVIDYGYHLDNTIPVLITNHSSHPVYIHFRKIVAELQWCTTSIHSQQCATNVLDTNTAFMSKFDFSQSDVTQDQLKCMQSFLLNNIDTFS